MTWHVYTLFEHHKNVSCQKYELFVMANETFEWFSNTVYVVCIDAIGRN